MSYNKGCIKVCIFNFNEESLIQPPTAPPLPRKTCDVSNGPLEHEEFGPGPHCVAPVMWVRGGDNDHRV